MKASDLDDGANVRLAVSVPPIGPFCPFRSQALMDNQQASSKLDEPKAMGIATEMVRLQLELSAGGKPDKARLLTLADDMENAWEEVSLWLTRMRLSSDFQAREYFKVIEAWAERQGDSVDSFDKMVSWQAGNLKAFANGEPPLPPPPDIDLQEMEQKTVSGQQNLAGMMAPPDRLDALPFTGREDAFKSELVKQEWDQLLADHQSIIKLGEHYGEFDPLGKIAYIDELEAIEGRWDVFFARFSLINALNPEFEQQSLAMLKALGMPGAMFREVLQEAHDGMRKDAEAERNLIRYGNVQ